MRSMHLIPDLILNEQATIEPGVTSMIPSWLFCCVAFDCNRQVAEYDTKLTNENRTHETGLQHANMGSQASTKVLCVSLDERPCVVACVGTQRSGAYGSR